MFNLAKENEEIGFSYNKAAYPEPKLNRYAQEMLLASLNANPKIYIYDGSDTEGECKEDVRHVVYEKPRRISQFQQNFLLKQIAKSIVVEKSLESQVNNSNLRGNNKSLMEYNRIERGSVLMNPFGLESVQFAPTFMATLTQGVPN